MPTRIGQTIFFIVTSLFFLISFLFLAPSVQAELEPRFLILHLDAVSAEDFFRELERGSIPNIERVFVDQGHIFKAMALFPGGTEVTVPRMKTGEGIYGEGPSGWGYYDYENERMVTKPEVAIEYSPSVLRRARGNFTNVFPLVDRTAIFDIMNIPSLLERYNVVEFYWFSTDFYGHYFGVEKHLDSIKRFDRYFGYLVDRIDLEQVNIILYVDHGMTFGESETLHYSEFIEEVVGENLLGERYPNIYLKEEDKKEDIARKLAEKEGIDLAFIREETGEIRGFHNQGEIIFSGKEGRIKYTYIDQDIFNYYELGYSGEYLDYVQWLERTVSAEYPAVPPLIFNYFDNPRTGEIVTVINHPYIFANPLLFKLPVDWIEEQIGFSLVMGKGSHAGLRHTDLLVPAMVRGPQLEHLYDKEVMWLQDIFQSIPELEFNCYEPSREEHRVSSWAGGGLEEISFSASFSPTYRYNIAVQKHPDATLGMVERDMLSTHSLRIWLGGGLALTREADFHWLILPSWEFNIGRLGIEWQYPISPGNISNKGTVSLRVWDGFRLQWHVSEGFGISYRF